MTIFVWSVIVLCVIIYFLFIQYGNFILYRYIKNLKLRILNLKQNKKYIQMKFIKHENWFRMMSGRYPFNQTNENEYILLNSDSFISDFLRSVSLWQIEKTKEKSVMERFLYLVDNYAISEEKYNRIKVFL